MLPAQAGSADLLASPVQFLKGVGPRRAELLKALGIATVQDLLYHLPREWEDRFETRDLSKPTATGKAALRGKVLEVEAIPFLGRSGLARFHARLLTPAGVVDALWFKRHSPRYDVLKALAAEVRPGTEMWIVGRVELTLLRIHEVHVDEHYPADDGRAALHVDRIVPVHPLTSGLNARWMRETIHQALERASRLVPEILPAPVRLARGLLDAAEALRRIHFPSSLAEKEAARRRLAYEEFFVLETALAIKRRQLQRGYKGLTYRLTRRLLTPFKERLGFEFTRAQKRVIREIFRDMQGLNPMNRLLQGEVGSGKTVVAASALLLAVENGYQGALMAPTEILAEQHYLTFQKLFKGLPVRVVLLTSKNTKAQRARLQAEIKEGKADVVVGTHAILEEGVAIPKLALAVIDEQHRFGVRQRTSMRLKGRLPDILVMTATPIPRTLALTLYGDLDISTLNELPPGRRPVATTHVGEKEAFEHLSREVRAGHQGFVVYPVIEESKRAELKAAILESERLQRDVFPDFRVGLLHGQMPPAKKDAVMEAFAAGEFDVLVSTPVVEVGVDVPNATVMVVQHAERFGLASLHQLRGRVGRSALDSWCFLVGEANTHNAEGRIEALCRTHDGFEISEMDLKLRGPGEILGTEQHGPLSLKVGDLVGDIQLIRAAKEDSASVLEKDPNLVKNEHQGLKTRLVEQYQRRWHWIDIS